MLITSSAEAAYDLYSQQNSLNGASDAVKASGNYGAGVTVGVIDTGVQHQWIGFSGNVDTANAACLLWGCASTLAINDDNGHGTFVASEIAGNYRTYGMTGVAPKATILPVKVLDAQGSGWGSDLADGIVYAVDHGAKVLNMSLGPSGSSQERADFFHDLASAINYAAAKNAIIVFAGGNDNVQTIGTLQVTGFTDAALQRMLFVGSTTERKRKSSFSNSPGTGGFVSDTGQFYALKNMWVAADGENIWGADSKKDGSSYDYITRMSGTSMAAPQAAGVAALLAARWPYLVENGTIAKIIEASAQDIGKKKADPIFGSGFLRADKALLPVGGLSVPSASGEMVKATNSTVLAGAAFGNMSSLSSAFRNAVAFDSFSRDFPLAYAGQVTRNGAGVSAATREVMGQTAEAQRKVVSLADGNWLAFSGSPEGASRDKIYMQDDPIQYTQPSWTYAFTMGDSYFGSGHGEGAALLFNDARWGRDSAFFGKDRSASGALLNLVPDADFSLLSRELANGARFSAGYVHSADNIFEGFNQEQAADGAFLAYTFTPARRWKVSLSASILSEKNMLLGSQSAGAMALASGATSTSYGMGTNFDLGKGYSLGFDAAYAITNPSAAKNSMVSNISQLDSYSMGVSLSKTGLAVPGDKLGFEVSKPLRVISGGANVTFAVGADTVGNPIISHGYATLSPTGNETDFRLDYQAPLDETTSGGLSLSARKDVDNIKGENDVAAMVRIKHSF